LAELQSRPPLISASVAIVLVLPNDFMVILSVLSGIVWRPGKTPEAADCKSTMCERRKPGVRVQEYERSDVSPNGD
ncbi:MAG: hypothetical protein R3198_12635, partial [Marinobacter sp.]|nr:hypothetical protein [Marinobacter sp.]